MGKLITILSWHDISSAYASLFYLHNTLKSIGHKVTIWGFSPKQKIQEDNREDYCSYTETWYGRIKRFRVYAAKIHAFFVALKSEVVIINDLDFFRVGYWVKKLFPEKVVIHYNTEIHGEDVHYPKHTIHFYEKHAGYPDMIIECLKERAEYRRNTYAIEKEIYVINNTLPYHDVEHVVAQDMDVSEYFAFQDKDIPTLIYAGGCGLNRGLGEIIASSDQFVGKANFLLLCYGTEEQYNSIEKLCSTHSNCYLHKAVDRKKLFSIMDKCDIGVQYYDPDISINHYLASPSKLYEYAALGLNILSSNNHGVDRIISTYDLGVCFSKDEGLMHGMERLLEKGLTDKEYIREVFRDKLAYEVDSKRAIEQLRNIIT